MDESTDLDSCVASERTQSWDVSSFFLNFSLLFLTLEFHTEIVARSVSDGIGLQFE